MSQNPDIIVLGDVMLDEHVRCRHENKLERGMPVLIEEDRKASLGGAANVAANIAGLGHRVLLLGAIGNDDAGTRMLQLCRNAGVISDLVRCNDRSTIVKTRYLRRDDSGLVPMFRVDIESDRSVRQDPLPLVESFLRQSSESRVAVISDYGKGYCDIFNIVKTVNALADAGLPLLVDPPRSGGWSKYSCKQLMLKFNVAQAMEFLLAVKTDVSDQMRRNNAARLCRLSELPLDTRWFIYEHLLSDVRQIYESIGGEYKYLWMTLGRDGSLLCNTDRSFRGFRVPGRLRKSEVVDVTGAGDTSLAVMATMVERMGYDFEVVKTGAMIANTVSAAAVMYDGTYVASKKDLLA